MSKSNCPFCGGKECVEKIVHQEVIEYKGQSLTIDGYSFSRCQNCGEDFETAAENKNADKLIVSFQREIDGLLNPSEIKAKREALGYSQKALAELLGIGEKNFARWENGSVTQSRMADHLLRVFFEHHDLVLPIVSKRGKIGNNCTEVTFSGRVSAKLDTEHKTTPRLVINGYSQCE